MFSPWPAPESFVRGLVDVVQYARKDADMQTLRGLLALESGAIEPAQSAFRESLSAWNGDGGAAFLARPYLGVIGKRWWAAGASRRPTQANPPAPSHPTGPE